MTTVPDNSTSVIVGVDTHADVHVAAVVDHRGKFRGAEAFAATRTGYRRLVAWATRFGPIDRIGIEGTGSWGRGLTLHCLAEGLEVVEVDRPDRKTRRFQGKSDRVDAEAAARAVLAGTATAVPKTGDGVVEMIRVLHITRETAIKARTQAINQLRALVVTAPAELREQLSGRSATKLALLVSGFADGPVNDPESAIRLAMREIGRRIQMLTGEIERLEAERDRLVDAAAPALVERRGIGRHSAAALLIAAGDNPERLRNEAAFASLCGVAPLPASSGRVHRHRLNRGGDRQANRALHTIVVARLACDHRTRAYVAKRRPSGKADLDVIRRLKRYVAREVFPLILEALSQPTEDLAPAA